MSEAEILFEKRGCIGVITLNRPKALNALTLEMCQLMGPQLAKWDDDHAIKAVVIEGAGEKGFCAGGDIRALHDSGKEGTPYAIDFYRTEYQLNAQIHHFRKPYIALMDGITMGGGVGVSVHGDHRIVTDRTVFAMPETGIGLYPDVGGSYFLPRCPGQLGMYLGLTGARLKAADSLYAGVGTAFMSSEKLEDFKNQLAEGTDITSAISSFQDDPGAAQIADHREQIDFFFSKLSVEEILAALDSDGSEWCVETAQAMRGKSPTSLKITYRQICEGAQLSFDNAMKMEFRMTNRIVEGHDFYEGVRAVVIDKDQSPKWSPDSLDDVSAEAVDAYFKPLGDKELQLP